MVYEGLGGSTRESVAISLGFPEDEQRFRDGFKVIVITYNEPGFFMFGYFVH